MDSTDKRRAGRGAHRVGSWSLAGRAVASAFAAALMVLTAQPPLATAATVGSDQSQAKQLEKSISQQGETIQQLVVSYDQALAKVETLNAKLLSTRATLISDQNDQRKAEAQVRQIAVTAFVNSSNLGSVPEEMAAGSLDTYLIEQEFANAVGGNVQDATDALVASERQTNAAAATLRKEQASAQRALNAKAQQSHAASVALIKEDNLLSHVKGNLKSLLAAAAQQRAAAEKAQEQALAAQEAQVATPNALPLVPTSNPAPGIYADPLRDIGGIVPERVDQGVDFSGFGPIYAMGDGVVLSTVNGGWPGGTFISYRLSDGPAQGLVVFAAEDIYPTVQPGQTVTAATQIGTMYEGPDGIETGWADPSGNGTSLANDNGQFSGTNSTAFGYNFSQFLESVGAPGGVLQNNPPTGSLPSGWPG